MKWISTTIKRIYMNEIILGTKKREYKIYNEFWKKRLDPLIGIEEEIGINFLCGQMPYKYHVQFIQYVNINWNYDIDGNRVNEFYIIYLGDRILEE